MIQNQWMNAPTFAYYTIYGKLPHGGFLRGRTSSPKKTWHGIPDIDIHIKDSWLNQLNSIPEIEIRASDEGKSPERPAFIIFRFKDPADDSKAKIVSEKLNSMPGIYSKSDIGAENRPRICVAGKIQYGMPGWEEWWDSLAEKIKNALGNNVKSSKFGNPEESLNWVGWAISGILIISAIAILIKKK